MAEKVAVAEKFGRLAIQPPSDSQKILDEVKDVTVRSHIQSLNNALGQNYFWSLISIAI